MFWYKTFRHGPGPFVGPRHGPRSSPQLCPQRKFPEKKFSTGLSTLSTSEAEEQAVSPGQCRGCPVSTANERYLFHRTAPGLEACREIKVAAEGRVGEYNPAKEGLAARPKGTGQAAERPERRGPMVRQKDAAEGPGGGVSGQRAEKARVYIGIRRNLGLRTSPKKSARLKLGLVILCCGVYNDEQVVRH
ncbi:MAG: hypothetical protein PWQ41_1088 [Bacillota bacterium]|nr:hypothetical protein [Bacillota bacterium]